MTRNVVDRGDSGAAPSRDGIEDAAERALAASIRTWDDASKALQGMLDDPHLGRHQPQVPRLRHHR